MRSRRVTTWWQSPVAVRTAWAIVAVLAGVAGCSDGDAPADADTESASPVVRTARRGPVELTVTMAKDRVSIAEPVELRLELRGNAEVDLALPEFGQGLDGFQIRDFQEANPQVAEDGSQTLVQTYELDMLVSGRYAIPPITAQYRLRPVDNSQSTETPPFSELATEPIEFEVTSLLEGEFDPTAFRDVKPVVGLPVRRDWRTWAWWGGGAIAALAVLAWLAVWAWRRSQAPRRAIPIVPHEWAFARLRELAEANLIERGAVREFYYRLSEIARRYIELRFGLTAAEQTTEEFLEAMRAGDTLPREQQGALSAFMEACDRVKYACHQPETDEIEQVFNAAREFVNATRAAADEPRELAA
jgi:hypothetical protein